ncbi:MAG: 5'/3'-nucleotidase SurE [Caldilineaceae bacterium]|nr:5'/3'-nucleotidase SurE [Caldilineaceae bacterium]
MTNRPLILLTNDDGIRSRGLQAAVRACAGLGDLLIVAPAMQQTATGRSKPPASTGRIERHTFTVSEGTVVGYGVDGSPAQSVEHALFELAPRRIDLTISGINYGENLGESIVTSGTIGAALEAASFGIPALAVSRQTHPEHFFNHDADVDFAVAAHFVRRFVTMVLEKGLPAGVDVLKIDVPERATPETPWRWTRVSRRRYFYPVAPQRVSLDHAAPMGFVTRAVPEELEDDSDIRAVVLDHVVSVSPLSGDLTARVDLHGLNHRSLNGA